VVDDSDTARQFLRSRLQAWGLDVETAASSGQALAMLLRQHFDHLFIDVELGSGSKLDGLALCQLVRRKHISCGGAPELVVIVSAHHGQLDRARGTLAGCDAYLGKPLDEADLDQLLRRQGLTPPATANPPLRG
jgi:CheY-like chemotaxis protein